MTPRATGEGETAREEPLPAGDEREPGPAGATAPCLASDADPGAAAAAAVGTEAAGRFRRGGADEGGGGKRVPAPRGSVRAREGRTVRGVAWQWLLVFYYY